MVNSVRTGSCTRLPQQLPSARRPDRHVGASKNLSPSRARNWTSAMRLRGRTWRVRPCCTTCTAENRSRGRDRPENIGGAFGVQLPGRSSTCAECTGGRRQGSRSAGKENGRRSGAVRGNRWASIPDRRLAGPQGVGPWASRQSKRYSFASEARSPLSRKAPLRLARPVGLCSRRFVRVALQKLSRADRMPSLSQQTPDTGQKSG